MTGKTFPIKSDKETVAGNKILVGKSRYTAAAGVDIPSQYPGKELFRVVAGANLLILAGNDAGIYKGSQFAVTYFLESLGFGWFGTDDLWTVMPKGDTIYATSCDITSQASFSSRYTRLSAAEPQLTSRWFVGGELTQTDHSLPNLVSPDLYGSIPNTSATQKERGIPAASAGGSPACPTPRCSSWWRTRSSISLRPTPITRWPPSGRTTATATCQRGLRQLVRVRRLQDICD